MRGLPPAGPRVRACACCAGSVPALQRAGPGRQPGRFADAAQDSGPGAGPAATTTQATSCGTSGRRWPATYCWSPASSGGASAATSPSRQSPPRPSPCAPSRSPWSSPCACASRSTDGKLPAGRPPAVPVAWCGYGWGGAGWREPRLRSRVPAGGASHGPTPLLGRCRAAHAWSTPVVMRPCRQVLSAHRLRVCGVWCGRPGAACSHQRAVPASSGELIGSHGLYEPAAFSLPATVLWPERVQG